MALSDGTASRDQVQEAQRRAQARRTSLERAAAVEAARASEVRLWDDGAQAAWHYVVLDDAEVRIERCEAHCACVRIPAEIEGKPVVALAAEACAHLPGVEEIICPDSVVSVGLCAFRDNRALRSVVLPAGLATFDSDWFRGSNAITHLVLPGRLARLDARIFDLPQLSTLVVGAGAAEVEPGAFAKSALVSVEVDAANPFLTTDGIALYRREGGVLLALAVPVEEYALRPGCTAVAEKGFSTCARVRRIDAPEGLEELGSFAFARTGIASFEAPASLKRIGEKAFFNCADLEDVRLCEGLVSVGANAFTGTRLRELRLPASVEELGNPLAAKTGLTFAGPEATCTLAAGSRHLILDAAGGLYRVLDQGVCLVRMMDPEARSYEARPDTVAVGDEAFVDHACIEGVVLPEGVEKLGRAAFKACRHLVRVNIPSSMRRIGDEAFLDTNLASVRIPAGLEYLGHNALVTHGAHHGDGEPSLVDVRVDAGNARFYTAPGLLLERKDEGHARVVLCTGGVDVVCIPAEVDEIAPYALNDVRGIRELYLSDRITKVGMRGLGIDGLAELIHVDLEQPVEGHTSFDLRFPATDRGAQQMMLALSVPDRVDVAALFEHYDNAIINASSFDPGHERGLDPYEQLVRLVARLQDPVYMTPVNHSMSEKVLREGVADFCVAAARHDDRRVVDALLDLGFLNADNLNAVIDRVVALKDAAMTAHLLEAKRLRFQRAALDFEL